MPSFNTFTSFHALRYSVTLVALLLPACLDNGEPEKPEDIATQSSAIFKSNAFGWSRDPNGVTTTVPICWDERDYPIGPPEPDRSTLKDFVRRAVEETWQRESGLIFSGWGDCHSGSQGTFGIDLHMSASDRGMTYSVHPFDPQHADVHLPIVGGTTNYLRYTVIHEIGHAVGLIHEQARLDHTNCNSPDDWDWLVTVPGGTGFSPYDDRSVMNYCAPNPTELSPLDIMGIQRIYGRKPGTNFVNSRGECVSTSGLAVMLSQCTSGMLQTFDPRGDSIRLKSFTGLNLSGRAAAPASNGVGALLMTSGSINPNWDIHDFAKVSIRGLAGKKLNVAYASTSPGASVIVWDDTTVYWASKVAPNEQWTFMPDGSIVGVGSQCLAVQGGNLASGTPVIMWPCNGAFDQKWRLAAGDQIVSELGDIVGQPKCLEANRDENNVTTPLPQLIDVRIADCNGSLQQKWSVRGAITTADGYRCISAPGTTGTGVAQAWCNGGDDQMMDVHW